MTVGIGKTLAATAVLVFSSYAISLSAQPHGPEPGHPAGPMQGEAGRPGPGRQGGAMQRQPNAGAMRPGMTPHAAPAPRVNGTPPHPSTQTPRAISPAPHPFTQAPHPSPAPRPFTEAPRSLNPGPHEPGHIAPRPLRPAPAPWHGDISRFRQHDIEVWRSGRWHHGPHSGRVGWWWIVGGIWYFYPAPVYPYPNPYAPPYVVAPTPRTRYWYYCPYYRQYYPYVASCPGGWQAVLATP